MADPTPRASALKSGSVDLVESLDPAAVGSLTASSGFRVFSGGNSCQVAQLFMNSSGSYNGKVNPLGITSARFAIAAALQKQAYAARRPRPIPTRLVFAMKPLRIALAQLAPRLGVLEENLARHSALVTEARDAGAGLVVFPELGLTGYQLQDLAAEVAMRIDDPRLLGLAAETGGLSAVVSFVEEADDHRLFISAALLEDGEIRFVHRKLFLPTYGLFDERRFFAAGDRLRTVDSRLGIKVGIALCEDFWHLSVPETLALDGAQLLINVSSSPGRDLAAIHEVGLGTAASWRTLMRTYAQLTTSFVVFCNRVGMDETISFWGGSEVIAPSGEALFTAPLFDEGLYTVDVELGDVRRERIGLPLLRDERPELHLRELRRILAERTGLDLDEASEPVDGRTAAPTAGGPTAGGPKGGPTRGQRTRR